MTRSDLFVINKTDLAPYVGADLGVMERDTIAFRNGKSFVFPQLKDSSGVELVAGWVMEQGNRILIYCRKFAVSSLSNHRGMTQNDTHLGPRC